MTIYSFQTKCTFLYILYTAITYALLFDPSFNVDYPIGLNHGIVGTTIGHELIHGFDNDGRHFDQNGDQANWWSQFSVANFNHLSKCFIHQYSSQIENITGLKVSRCCLSLIFLLSFFFKH